MASGAGMDASGAAMEASIGVTFGSEGEVVDAISTVGGVGADVFWKSAGGGKRWKKRISRGGSDFANWTCCEMLIVAGDEKFGCGGSNGSLSAMA